MPLTERTIMQNQASISPQTGFLRISQILKLIPVGRSTWWAWVKSNKAPAPVKLSERVTCWKAEDIHRFIAELGEGKGGAAC
jgi:prophage regulatory protein